MTVDARYTGMLTVPHVLAGFLPAWESSVLPFIIFPLYFRTVHEKYAPNIQLMNIQGIRLPARPAMRRRREGHIPIRSGTAKEQAYFSGGRIIGVDGTAGADGSDGGMINGAELPGVAGASALGAAGGMASRAGMVMLFEDMGTSMP